jgi:hypothetical protein
MKMGTDLIIIEKEGAVEVLAPFADKYGIALLNSRGFLTEYANRLSSLSKKYGSNVVILTDFDVSGLLLATKLPDNNIRRIGVDFKTIEYFGLDINSVHEQYNPDNNHLQPLQNIAKYNSTLQKELAYLHHHRIEIDSVLAKVGSEQFWNYILEELSRLFPIRNYNRAIDIPESIFPKEIESFVETLKVKINKITLDEIEKIKKELEFTEGFIDDIGEKKKVIKERLLTIISNDKDIEDLVSSITKINI